MLQARCFPYRLKFKRPSGTSRGVLKTKESWFIEVWDTDAPDVRGLGECGLLRGLSIDDRPDYAEKVQATCDNINDHQHYFDAELREFPSIQFGLETALLDLKAKGSKCLFTNKFSIGQSPIWINGLIWMGDEKFMHEQIEQKLQDGFKCIKMKIGAIDFEQELALLQSIRNSYSPEEIELRVDANGAFHPDEAMEKLEHLAALELHSIEQPIKAGQWNAMAKLCEDTPLPIALDEELIGLFDYDSKQACIDTIAPQYIILKPSLVGGFSGSQDWIDLADERSIPWWITSALESNIGLNAIAQWTYTHINPLPQGLGTGQLYTNNVPSPLEVAKGKLRYNASTQWDLSVLENVD